MGLVPGSTYRNRVFRINPVDIDSELSPYLIGVLFTLEISGGLLITVGKEKAKDAQNIKRRRDR